jgi:hypothetical protein
VIGAVLFVVGVVAAIVAVAAVRNPHGRQVNSSGSVSASTATMQTGSTRFSTPSSSSNPSSSSSPSKSRPSKPQTAIYILNNTIRPDLGATTAAKFRAKGWHVVGTENYSNDIISSCAYYDPSDPQNLTVAQKLQSSSRGSNGWRRGSRSCRPIRSSSSSTPITPAELDAEARTSSVR